MKHKILILPTYFPTHLNPIIGSQVKEQTELLQPEFDIRVIHCMKGMGFIRFVLLLLIPFLRKNIYKDCSKQLKGDSLITSGVYYYQNSMFSDRFNLYIQERAYDFVFRKLVKRNWHPDLIHARGTDYAGFIANYLSLKYKTPYILSENTAFLLDEYISNFTIKTYRNAINNAKSLLFVSNFLKQITLMHGIGLNATHYVVGNAVDDIHFKILNMNRDEHMFKIFTTGYNSHIKDFDTFFKAIKLVIENGHNNIEVTIGITYAWSEDNYKELITKAKNFGVEQYCNFILKIPRNEMPIYFNKSNCYIQTSIIETFGISCLEALACGTPVISTNNGGINDIITKNNGIVIPINDHVNLAEAIIKIKNKYIIFDQKILRESIISKFGKEHYKNAIVEILNRNIR